MNARLLAVVLGVLALVVVGAVVFHRSYQVDVSVSPALSEADRTNITKETMEILSQDGVPNTPVNIPVADRIQVPYGIAVRSGEGTYVLLYGAVTRADCVNEARIMSGVCVRLK